MAKKKSRLDWPQVALVLGVGALALYALIHLDAEKLGAITPEQWTLIASAVTGVVTTVLAAIRGPAVSPAAAPVPPEPRPRTPDLSDAPRNPPTPSGAFRTGEPPEAS